MTNELKFAADFPLGKLAKWLRVLGLYCAYPISFDDFLSLKKTSPPSKLYYLTRTHTIREGQVIFIGEDRVTKQLDVLKLLLPVLSTSIKPFSRCIECNVALERIEKNEVSFRVPEYVYHTQDEFSTCPNCKKIFWPATHYQHMRERVMAIFC